MHHCLCGVDAHALMHSISIINFTTKRPCVLSMDDKTVVCSFLYITHPIRNFYVTV